MLALPHPPAAAWRKMSTKNDSDTIHKDREARSRFACDTFARACGIFVAQLQEDVEF
jgi:hypothetical protein